MAKSKHLFSLSFLYSPCPSHTANQPLRSRPRSCAAELRPWPRRCTSFISVATHRCQPGHSRKLRAPSLSFSVVLEYTPELSPFDLVSDDHAITNCRRSRTVSSLPSSCGDPKAEAAVANPRASTIGGRRVASDVDEHHAAHRLYRFRSVIGFIAAVGRQPLLHCWKHPHFLPQRASWSHLHLFVGCQATAIADQSSHRYRDLRHAARKSIGPSRRCSLGRMYTE